MKTKSQFSCMYLVPPEIYKRLLDTADAREKVKVQELNAPEVGNEIGAFPSLPNTPDYDANTSQDNNDGDDGDDYGGDDDGDGGDDGGRYDPPSRRPSTSSSSSRQSSHGSTTDTASETERHLQNNMNSQNAVLSNRPQTFLQQFSDSEDDNLFSSNFAKHPELLRHSLDPVNTTQPSTSTSSRPLIDSSQHQTSLENSLGPELERIMNDMIKIRSVALEQQRILQDISKKAKKKNITSNGQQATLKAIEHIPQQSESQLNPLVTSEIQPLIPQPGASAISKSTSSIRTEIQPLIPQPGTSAISKSTGAIRKSYLCDICQIKFVSNKLLIQHKKDFHFPKTKITKKNQYISWNKKDKKPFEKKESSDVNSDMAFIPQPDISIIQDSNITQSDDVRKSYPCDICGIIFATNELLINHKKDFHFPETVITKKDRFVNWKNDKKQKKLKKILKKKRDVFKKLKNVISLREKKKPAVISLEKGSITMEDNSRNDNVSMDDSIIVPNPSNFSAESISILQCKLCPATFNTKKGFERHLKNIHETYSDYNPKNKQGTKRKIENTNGNIIENTYKKKKKAVHFYKCKLCSSSFKEKKSHDRHLKNIHSTDKDYRYNLQQGKKRKRESETKKKSTTLRNQNYKKWK